LRLGGSTVWAQGHGYAWSRLVPVCLYRISLEIVPAHQTLYKLDKQSN
jgi:hypothetical protein